MHRALADPRCDGRPSASRLHDILAAALPLDSLHDVLDAGCGLGGTMLDLAQRSPARFTGLTLSERQAAIGRAAIARAGYADRVRLLVGHYDEPPAARFDLVIAIESLAHSESPAATLAALTSRLGPNGLIAIVDDMPEPAARGSRDLAHFQHGWRLPVLCSATELRGELERLGLTVTLDRDLTPELRPRPLANLCALVALNGALRRVAPSARWRRLLDSYRGGLALESLYRAGLMRYRLVVAQRP